MPVNAQLITGADVRGSPEVVVFDCQEPTMKPLSAMGTCWNDVPAIGTGYDGVRDQIQAHVAALLDQLTLGTSGRW